MKCVRFANVMNNKAIINTLNSNNSYVTYIKLQHRQIVITTKYIILKFEPIIKKLIVANYTFFTVITFSNINFFPYINSIVIKHLQGLFNKNDSSSVSKENSLR